MLVVIDEAYGEVPAAPSSPLRRARLARIASQPRRRAHALEGLRPRAGLRVGYAFAHPDVAELMNRVRQPFNVNHLAMVAACAALEDHEFIAKSRAVNARGARAARPRASSALGFEYIPSRGNFITVRVGDAARVLRTRCCAKASIVRPIAGYGMPEHLRVTVGLPEHNERFLAALERALGAGCMRRLKTLAVVGVGLIGGSFALALRRAGVAHPHRRLRPRPRRAAKRAARARRHRHRG